MRSKTTRLLLNSLSGALLFLASVVIAFIMSPILLRELGNAGYGIWEMILSVCGYLGILELGVGPAIVRYVSREQAIGSQEGLNRILSSAFWGLLLVGGLALAILSIAAFRPEAVLGVPSGDIDGLSLLFVIVGCSMCTQFVGTLFTAYLFGSQEHFKINSVRFIMVSMQSIGIYLVLTRYDSFELPMLAGVLLLSKVIQYGVFAIMVLHRSEVAFRRDAFSWRTSLDLYRFGASSMILMVSDRVQQSSLPLVIGHTLGPANVVLFAIPKRLIGYAQSFVLALGHPLMPYLSAIDARRVPGERMEQWLPLSRAIAFVTVPGALLLLALGKPFIAIWLGTSYAEGGQWVTVALALSFLLRGPFYNSGQVLVASARHGPPARKLLVISLVAVTIAIPVTNQLGVTGAAIVLALAEFAGVWILWCAASQVVGIGLAEHLRTTVRPLLLPAGLMAAALGAGRWLIPTDGYVGLAGIAGGSVALYMGSVWQVTITRAERAQIRRKLDGLFDRFRRCWP